MSDTPDIGKIISLIMENPSLIEQISALAKSDKLQNENSQNIEADATEAVTSAPINLPENSSRQEKRSRLLNAMKPYLSESRSKAIDSMIGIVGILDMMKGGG